MYLYLQHIACRVRRPWYSQLYQIQLTDHYFEAVPTCVAADADAAAAVDPSSSLRTLSHASSPSPASLNAVRALWSVHFQRTSSDSVWPGGGAERGLVS